jgi:hypothetical protein
MYHTRPDEVYMRPTDYSAMKQPQNETHPPE